MSFRAVSALAVAALVVLSGAFLYTASRYFETEEERLQRDANSALEAVSAAFEQPAEQLSRTLSDSTLTSFEDVWLRVNAWTKGTGAAGVVRDVHVFDVRDGAFLVPRGGRSSSDTSLVPWTHLFRRASQDIGVALEASSGLVALQPSLVVPIVTLTPDPNAPGATGLVGFALIRFDADALATGYVPEALRGRVDLENVFEIRVRSQSPNWNGGWHPDVTSAVNISGNGTIALLAPSPPRQILSPPVTAPDASSTLVVGIRYREGSVARRFATARRFGYAVAWIAIVLVGGSTMLALVTARRALDLKAAQMHFVAGISHELRTPIAVINTAAQNLRDRIVTSDENVQKYGELIQRHADRLNGLVERTLTFAATRSGGAFQDREWVDVAAVIRDVARACDSPGRAPRLYLQIAPSLPPLYADPHGVRVLVENVVSNALKYSESGVSVEADATPAGLHIRVVDHGPGIPKDERRRVFEPFFRGRVGKESPVGGTGLGLGLVQSVADSHDARVTLSETLGGGATVTVVFPVATAVNDRSGHEKGHVAGGDRPPA